MRSTGHIFTYRIRKVTPKHNLNIVLVEEDLPSIYAARSVSYIWKIFMQKAINKLNFEL